MLPQGANIMLNAAQYWKQGTWSRRLGRPRNAGKIFLDSGGFVFFNKYQEYPFTAVQYLNLIALLRPDFYASLDYPCEPTITGKLGLETIDERIEATVANTLELMRLEALVPESRLVPVIQGWEIDDYRKCLDMYAAADAIRPYMAVGSVCTRSNDENTVDLIRQIHEYATNMGVERLHLFGLKMSEAISAADEYIYSRDSAAVYFAANREMRRAWGDSRFAPTREAKRQAVRHWLNRLNQRNITWQTLPG